MALKEIIEAGTQTLVEHVEELTALDAAIGDGDHGLNMRRGALAIRAKLGELGVPGLAGGIEVEGLSSDGKGSGAGDADDAQASAGRAGAVGAVERSRRRAEPQRHGATTPRPLPY